MSKTSGKGSSGPKKKRGEPPEVSTPGSTVETSRGNGTLQQLLNFVKDLSEGNNLQKCIAAIVVVGALLLAAGAVLAVAVIVVVRREALPWAGGAATITGITAFIAKRGRSDKSRE